MAILGGTQLKNEPQFKLQTSLQLMAISSSTKEYSPRSSIKISVLSLWLLRSADKKRAEIKLNCFAFLLHRSVCDITIPPTMEINLLAKHLFTARQIAEMHP
jgi:hypothetical protein